jgi:hypothetical protein
MYFRKLLQVSAVSSFALFSAGAQAAPDAQKVSDALTAAFAGYGMDFKASAAEADGENIILKGLTIKMPKQPDGAEPKSQPIDVTLQNVTEDDANYIIGQVSAPAASYPVTDGTWEFGGASLNGARIAKDPNAAGTIAAMLYDSVEMQPTKFVSSTGAGELINIGLLKATMSPYAEGQPMTFDMTGDFSVNAKALSKDNPQAGPVLDQLGLNDVKTNIIAKGSWDPKSGLLDVTQETFDIVNVGKFDFKFALSGYTPEFIKAVQQMTKDSSGASSEEQGMKMMGMMQQLTFNSAAIRFDDAGITTKLLDMAATMSGQPRDAIIMQAKGMAPMVAMQLGDAAVTQQLSEAVNVYLDNPKSLEIKLAPSAPVPFSLITATGMSTPQALVQQLGMSISANQ